LSNVGLLKYDTKNYYSDQLILIAEFINIVVLFLFLRTLVKILYKNYKTIDFYRPNSLF